MPRAPGSPGGGGSNTPPSHARHAVVIPQHHAVQSSLPAHNASRIVAAEVKAHKHLDDQVRAGPVSNLVNKLDPSAASSQQQSGADGTVAPNVSDGSGSGGGGGGGGGQDPGGSQQPDFNPDQKGAAQPDDGQAKAAEDAFVKSMQDAATPPPSLTPNVTESPDHAGSASTTPDGPGNQLTPPEVKPKSGISLGAKIGIGLGIGVGGIIIYKVLTR